MSRRTSILALFVAALLSAKAAPQQSAPLQDGETRVQAIRTLAGALGVGAVLGEPVKCGLPIHAGYRVRGRQAGEAASAAAAVLFPRDERQTSILRSGWKIHFDTTGVHEPALLNGSGARIPGSARAYAESVGTALATVTGVECGRLGYPSPLSDGVLGGGPEPDLYIEEMGGTYGMTYPDVEGGAGATSTAFMTIDNDFNFVTPARNKGLPGMKVTVAHEFHHVIQLSRYGYWPNEVYYYEMTSTWLEDVVYTEVNDYLNYLRWSFSQFQTPTVSFTSNTEICYSRGIWCHFVAKKFGDVVIKRSWEEILRRRPLEAIDAALREAGSSFALALNEWTRWNYYTAWRADTLTGYPEGRSYPPMVQVMREFVEPVLTLQGGLSPLAARYHAVVIPKSGGPADTLTTGVVRTDIAAEPGGGTENYTVTLRSAPLDATYQETGTALFGSFSVPSPSGWGIWYLSAAGAIQPNGLSDLAEGMPFPNPFRPEGQKLLSIPVDAATSTTASLLILDAGLSRVHSSDALQGGGGTRRIFTWDGRTAGGGLAPSGIYLYVLTLSDGRRLMGKFAVLH